MFREVPLWYEDVEKTFERCSKTFKAFFLSAVVSFRNERSEVSDEMARDEARHGKAFAGLLKRYFGV